jgi:hypothetical protein
MELRLLLWLGASPAIGSWLAVALTYLAHSLLWAGAAALLARRAALSSAARHLYWKLALFGPLVTALVASAASARLQHALGGVSCVREFSGSARAPVSAAHSRAELVAWCGLGSAGLGWLRFQHGSAAPAASASGATESC